MEITIMGGALTVNEGAAAMTYTAANIIEELYPDASINIITARYDTDSKRLSENWLLIKTISGKKGWLKLLKNCFLSDEVVSKLLDVYKKSDLILDVTGDTYSDDYGFEMSFNHLIRLLLAVNCNKNVIVMPQSIGPYDNFITRPLSKICFNKCVSVLARENITFNYLKNFKIQTLYNKIILDLAFHMKTQYDGFDDIQSKIDLIKKNNNNLIGISLSNSISKFANKNRSNYSIETNYVQKMINLIDSYTSKGFYFVFIPHVWTDSEMCNKIFKLVKNKEKIILLKKHLLPMQLKGVISQCDLFIGARMHANIAALSTSVPIVAISYSHKTQGIMNLCGQLKYVVDVKKLTSNELIQKIDNCWMNRKKIKSELKKRVTELKKVGKQELVSIIKNAKENK